MDKKPIVENNDKIMSKEERKQFMELLTVTAWAFMVCKGTIELKKFFKKMFEHHKKKGDLAGCDCS